MRDLLDLERANIEQLLGIRTYLLAAPSLDIQQHLSWQNPAFSTPHFLEEQVSLMQPGDLYQLTDPFSCQYLALRIRDEVLLCGPYLNEMPDKSRIHSLLVANQLDYSQQTALQNYLNFIPICEDLPIFTALQLLFRAVEGPLTHVNYQHFHHLPIAATSLSYPPKEGQTANLQLIENSYALEDKMLAAVARGNAREALEQLSELLRTGSRHVRTGERVRDERNLCFVLGALLRKTAQQAGVHPVFLDSASGDFARQIEQCRTSQEISRLRIRMVRTYCELVDRLQNKTDSLLVRKTLNYIQLNLTANLTVEEIATAIGCSPNYLSTVFNQELQQSVTDYIHDHRLGEAADLLRKTNLSIQSIAVYVGYADTNYFSRLFRRHYQTTPTAYRKNSGWTAHKQSSLKDVGKDVGVDSQATCNQNQSP